MTNPFSIAISNELTVPTIKVDSPEDLSKSMNDLGFHDPRPILVILGGAAKMSQTDLDRLRSLFVKVLAPVVEELGAFVVDGGTDFGVMQMIGQARAEISGKFALIGVTPVGKVALPGHTHSEEVTALEPNHSHFVLTPGTNWGDESPWLADVATVLAKGSPSVAILVNGGEISKQDVSHNLRANRPVLAVAGSGRLADTLAFALEGEASDEEVRELVASGLVQAIDFKDSFDSLTELIKSYLS
ncbi:hypothetical protein WJM97_01985 [Okeanomitos corallinicola TIOX110]|uniref:LSDAT prokaryote domain-containing protein n=1 Tax=Okeanomitos corallinicola TIOX110 TaxID=3133117 RepID=A0ABZ2USV8_9CYAN